MPRIVLQPRVEQDPFRQGRPALLVPPEFLERNQLTSGQVVELATTGSRLFAFILDNLAVPGRSNDAAPTEHLERHFPAHGAVDVRPHEPSDATEVRLGPISTGSTGEGIPFPSDRIEREMMGELRRTVQEHRGLVWVGQTFRIERQFGSTQSHVSATIASVVPPLVARMTDGTRVT